jgi:hypothetical protein
MDTGRTEGNEKLRLVGKESGSFSIVENSPAPPRPISDFTHIMKLKAGQFPGPKTHSFLSAESAVAYARRQ